MTTPTNSIESPEAFARRMLVSANALEDIDDEEDILDVVGVVTEQVRSRDAAVRREALREHRDVADDHIVKMHELNAAQHRIILSALAGDVGPARAYEALERALATGGSDGR